MQNCIDWIKKSNSDRKAIVIASDVAKYELASTGEYTQGAGAVAMFISSNPSIILNETFGISMEHVGDFFKPRRLLRNKDLNGDIDIKTTSTNKAVLELFYEEPV